jgi:hypothetical protein
MLWIVYTIAVMLHLWLALILLRIWALLDDPRVRWSGAKIVISNLTLVPFTGTIGFWMWWFFG